jgi:DNA-binding NarL/FixJ family response regulator
MQSYAQVGRGLCSVHRLVMRQAMQARQGSGEMRATVEGFPAVAGGSAGTTVRRHEGSIAPPWGRHAGFADLGTRGPAGHRPGKCPGQLSGMTASARQIRVAIVDDHPVVREGTAALLGAQPGLRMVGTASSLGEALPLLDPARVDVLLDIRLGTESGLSALSGGAPKPAIVVLTAYDYPQYAAAARRLGASGFVVKTAPVAELVEAIRCAAAGGEAFGCGPDQSAATRPTARELEVVRLVADGRSNDEIGAALGITTKTVEGHLRRLFERLEVQSRTELATRAVREGWMEVP